MFAKDFLGAKGSEVICVSIGDVVKYRLDEALRAEESMLDYIQGTGYSYHSYL